MSEVPKRPESVPEGAWWDENDQEWVLGEKDDDGQLHGVVRYFRADGTLCNECEFVNGVPHGSFKRFHENGELSQEGQFVEGQLHGARTFHGTDSETSEQMPTGVSDKVFKAVMEYDMGSVTGGQLFDRDGNLLQADGSPVPSRPSGVPEDAHFSEKENCWYTGSFDENNRRKGLWRFWNHKGELSEESEFENGDYHGTVKRFHEGKPRDVTSYREGSKHGDYQGIVLSGIYADSQIRIEKGSFENGYAAGTWSFFDAKGHPVAKVDLGTPCTDEELAQSRSMANQIATAREWSETSRGLMREHRVTEAVCAMARAAAAEQKVDALASLLERTIVPLSDEEVVRVAESVFESTPGSLSALGNALLRGADTAAILRGMAIVLDQKFLSRAALDMVNAALLLAPDRAEYYFTRSLVNMSLGNDMAAQEDAQMLASKEPENAEFLANYIRVLFPIFDFWPAREPPETHYDSLPEKPEQNAEEIRHTIQKYATRLHHIREAMLGKIVGRPDWLLPDMSGLLPGGPIELRAWEFEINDPDDPDDPYSVSVDETIDVSEWEIPGLLRIARAEWNALCWLCWAAGYDRVCLSGDINPPPNFGVAAGMAAARLWRCRDLRVTGGSMAQQQEVPGFKWENMDIDEMHPALAQIAESQYADMQALFYWLTNEDNQSPWQDNLRGS